MRPHEYIKVGTIDIAFLMQICTSRALPLATTRCRVYIADSESVAASVDILV